MCPAKSTIVPFKKQMYSSGSIILSYKDDKCICVSIHAPTRGATWKIHANPHRQGCFNPRTHEGCDKPKQTHVLRPCRFQSTHPRGVRHSVVNALNNGVFVSIHAPTRGATDKIIITYIVTISFNPRTHEGCDSSIQRSSTRLTSFNPRTHEGCDFYLCVLMLRMLCFNPRTHEGCDFLWSLCSVPAKVSIHAPTRGATDGKVNRSRP